MWLLQLFFNDTATTKIYTLSLHDALPIYDAPLLVYDDLYRHGPLRSGGLRDCRVGRARLRDGLAVQDAARHDRSEEHTSELQSQSNLVCRLLLEKKNKKDIKRRCLIVEQY